jgi:hypothetical protein
MFCVKTKNKEQRTENREQAAPKKKKPQRKTARALKAICG